MKSLNICVVGCGYVGLVTRAVALLIDAVAIDVIALLVGGAVNLILSMFGVCDALVGDVSSVTLDFLFARPECPIFLTDRRDDRDLLLIDSPLAADTDIIDSSTIRGFGSLLADRLGDDARLEDRARARKHYFGDLQPGESTQRFIAAVSDLIAVRDQDLVGHRRVSIGDVDEHG